MHSVPVHAAVHWLAVVVGASSPGVVPKAAPVALLLVADNFRNFDTLPLHLVKVVESAHPTGPGANNGNPLDFLLLTHDAE